MTYTYKLSRRLASSHETVRTLRPLVLFLLALLATACGTGELTDPSKQPDADRATPGWLSLMLTTPNADDGAVQLTVAGSGIDSLRLSDGQGFVALSANGVKVLLTGTIRSGQVARLWVRDTRNAAGYGAAVDEAASKGTYALRDVTVGYGVRVTR